ncbi:unnamed protein product [Coregonus sp. 'balchen']|nr:unnamed protein product [Coregonus sp. 'balchen']
MEISSAEVTDSALYYCAMKTTVTGNRHLKKHLDLEISSAEVTESALCYCAVRPTVTGNLHCKKKNSAGTTSAGIYLVHFLTCL